MRVYELAKERERERERVHKCDKESEALHLSTKGALSGERGVGGGWTDVD